MSNEILGLILIGCMLLAIFVGFPISFTLIFLGLVFGYIGFGQLVFWLMTLQFNSVILEQTLAAVPLFVFMGIMMEQAGLMERLFEAVRLMLSRTRGALYFAVLFVSTIFAAATGIVGASVTILGIMAARTMDRAKYDVRLSAGAITAGGTLGILIPPSIMLVVMGPILEVPVTDLFAAAVVPGFMLATLYAGYATLRCFLNPSLGPPMPESERPTSMGHVWREFLLGLVPPSALVFSALGSILLGFATPTEGAGCGAFGALVLALAYRRLTDSETARGAGEDAGNFSADIVSGRRVQLFRRGVFAAGDSGNADRLAFGPGPAADGDTADDYGADFPFGLAAGVGSDCFDYCSHPFAAGSRVGF